MNMVDPRFFKQDAGVGQWVDAMTRIQGTIVSPLACTMLSDWALESGESLLDLFQQLNIQPTSAVGSADIQVVPSGPGQSGDGLLHMILELIHSADTELILTTPYLIPDDSLLRALRGAAARSVRVQIIVPEKVDSFLTRHASRSYFDDLIDAGIQIYLYRDGLLHTKSITVDKEISMFGTVNFDMRSFWLNYEVALFAYDSSFTQQLRDLQQSYINDSTILDKSSWNVRPFTQKLLENTLRLASPLL
jgi:cardiolipin synthase